jgi:hypothetical protein
MKIEQLERGDVTKAILDMAGQGGRLTLVLSDWIPEWGDPVIPGEDEIRAVVATTLGRPVRVASLGAEGYGPHGAFADVWQVEVEETECHGGSMYRIENKKSGLDLGIYHGRTEGEALEALAKEAGYATYQDMCEVGEVPAEDELRLTEMEEIEVDSLDVICPVDEMDRAEALVEAANEEGEIEPEALVGLFPGQPHRHIHCRLATALAWIGAEIRD